MAIKNARDLAQNLLNVRALIEKPITSVRKLTHYNFISNLYETIFTIDFFQRIINNPQSLTPKEIELIKIFEVHRGEYNINDLQIIFGQIISSEDYEMFKINVDKAINPYSPSLKKRKY